MKMVRIYSVFGSESPRSIADSPCIIIGGTPLLQNFLEEAGSLTSCTEIWICSPFVDGKAASLLPRLALLASPSVTLNFITSSESAIRTAWKVLTPLPWRDFSFGLYEGWHAKIYLAMGRDNGRICLTGSHNFTEAGAARNVEAGVLFISYGKDEVADTVCEVRSELEVAMGRCLRIYNRIQTINDATSAEVGR